MIKTPISKLKNWTHTKSLIFWSKYHCNPWCYRILIIQAILSVRIAKFTPYMSALSRFGRYGVLKKILFPVFKTLYLRFKHPEQWTWRFLIRSRVFILFFWFFHFPPPVLKQYLHLFHGVRLRLKILQKTLKVAHLHDALFTIWKRNLKKDK